MIFDEPGLRLTRPQKTAVLLTWLMEEQSSPSPTTRGLGGPITSGYVQEQIIRGLCVAHPYVIERILSSGHVADARMRDALILALGELRDVRQIPQLERIVETSDEPFYRRLGAVLLGQLGAVQCIPVLERSLEDDFRVPEYEDGGYPIRSAAEFSLRILRNPEALTKVRGRSAAAFQTRLRWQAEDLFARKPCVELQRVTARLLSPGAKVNLV